MKLSIRTKLILLLFFLIVLTVALISGQSYRIATKDMSNNAKASTRIYAKNISDVIQERLDVVKEKVLMAEMNETKVKNGSDVIFERSPEILAVTKYSFDTQFSKPTMEGGLINPLYIQKQNLTGDNFSSVDQVVDFKLVFKNNEYLNIGRIPNYPTEVMTYAFPIKVTGSQGLYVFVVCLVPNLIVKNVGVEAGSQSSATGGGKYINYLVDSKGRILVHPDQAQLTKNVYQLSLFKDFFNADVVTERTSEYVDENDQKVIGSIFKIKRSNIGIVSKILAKDAYAEAQKLKSVFLLTTLFAFVISIVIGVYFAKTLSDPLVKLARVTGEIARGNFLVKVDVTSHDEIGELAGSFGKMGQELYNREQELNAAHTALIQSEKMSAFGQISAGIAHEVKNPLTGILGHAQLTKEKLVKLLQDQFPPDIDNSLGIIEKETKRCKTIVENLMKFSRQEKTQFVEEDISAVVRGAVGLVDHQLTINGVKIFKEIPDGFPKVMCSGNQVEQVLMNIMMNAQHAMETRSEKKVTVRLKQGRTGFARIEIADTGTGIPEEVKKKIFEPFFTTKPAGKGTGLGLSVSYGIVKDHKGTLEVESVVDKGTTFIIELPYKDSSAVADASKLTMPKVEIPVAHKPQAVTPQVAAVKPAPQPVTAAPVSSQPAATSTAAAPPRPKAKSPTEPNIPVQHPVHDAKIPTTMTPPPPPPPPEITGGYRGEEPKLPPIVESSSKPDKNLVGSGGISRPQRRG